MAGAQQATPDNTVPDVPAPAQPGNGNNGGNPDPCAGQPSSGGDQTLTGQLSQCGGVLSPPPTGDDTQAPVPDPNPGTTPVVPPQAVPDQTPDGGDTAPAPNGGSDPSSNSG